MPRAERTGCEGAVESWLPMDERDGAGEGEDAVRRRGNSVGRRVLSMLGTTAEIACSRA